MNSKLSTSLILGIAVFLSIPLSSNAATVYLDSSKNTVSVGDTVIVNVKINAEGVTANTVDGNIVVKSGVGNMEVKEFSLANSAFGLWPRTPSLSKDGKNISFVGGVPGGFNIEGATLFKIIFQAKKAGSVTLIPENTIVYANDGKGTKLPVNVKSLTLNVVASKTGSITNDEWGAVVSKDTNPPEDFIIVLGQDQSMFEGKKFAYFSAVDNQTGIAYYEVSENGGAPVRSGSTYLIQNQEKDTKLIVTAVDRAGNKKISAYPTPQAKDIINWFPVLVSVLLLLILESLFGIFKRNKKNVSKPE